MLKRFFIFATGIVMFSIPAGLSSEENPKLQAAAAPLAQEELEKKEKEGGQKPQPPQHCEIGRSSKGIVQNPTVHLVDGRLVVQYVDNEYLSDAVQKNIEYVWKVSEDGGKSWKRIDGPPAEIAGEFYQPASGTSHAPKVRGGRLKNGTLLAVGSYGWENFRDSPEQRAELDRKGYYYFTPEEGNAPGTISISHRAWMSRSKGNGHAWEPAHQIQLPMFIPHLCKYGGGMALADGAFVQPMWGRFDLKKEPKYVSSLVLRTVDGGDRWTIHTVARHPKFDLGETSITQASNGQLVALVRTTDAVTPGLGQHDLWTAVSKDGGVTWSEPRDSGLDGSTPWLVTTADGLVVAFYIRRGTSPGGGGFDRTGVYACVSRDHGQSWDVDHQVALLDTGTETVDGYPTAVLLQDGTVYGVYGFRGGTTVGGTRFDPRHPEFGVLQR